MSALMDLVAQNQPQFQTHQALLVIGLQNDFVLPDGRLPVNIKKGFLERIQVLIPKFRELNGNVIWVQTLYEGDRIATDANTGEGDALVVGGLIDGDESSTEGGDEEPAAKDAKDLPPAQSRSSKHKQRALDLLKRVSARRKTIPQEVAKATAEEDDELFLLKSEKKIPACVPDTFGAEFADVIARQFELPADSVIRTTNYSAFQGTNLLMTLRARLVTELYICGCITNVSVLATVIDAARHGIKINVVEDCLGYRKQTRHDLALKRMDEFFDAYMVNSVDILAREPPASPPKQSSSPNGSRKGSKGNDRPIEALVGKMSLNDEARPVSRTSNTRSPTRVLSGKQRTLSLVSVAESRKTTQSTTGSAVEPIPEPQTEPTDKQFADMLVKGANVPGAEKAEPEKEKPNLVKTKIRMRSNQKRKKKKDKEKEGEASTDKSQPAEALVEPSTPSGKDKAASNATPLAPVVPPKQSQETQRTSLIAKAGSIANLREKENKPQPLKSVASVPVLSAKTEEKERNRLSDLSDRMRLSFSRAPKTESGSEARKSLGGGSIKGAVVPGKVEKQEKQKDVRSREHTPAPEVERKRSVGGAATAVKVEKEEKKDMTARSREHTPAPSMESKRSIVVPPTPAKVDEERPKETAVKSAEEPLTDKKADEVVDTQPLARTPPPASNSTKSPKLQSLATFPVLGPGDTIAEGDSRIIHDFFPNDFRHPTNPDQPLKDIIFTQLYNEVRWQKMMHQQGEVPRLVCCQGSFGDNGSMPVYRHPSDQTLPLLHFSPKVQLIRKQAEKLVGHPLNHVLIQLYRSGYDYISEHSDKTLDIVPSSSIVNVSFGAQRTMRLRTKKAATTTTTTTTTTTNSTDTHPATDTRETQRVPLPHNSMFTLGLASNAKWLHGIMPDKRAPVSRSTLETAHAGLRISLTFRQIGTFIDARGATIWGQGATAKEHRDAVDVLHGDEDEVKRLLTAFSRENHDPGFTWDEGYGAGFDVLHLHDSPADDAGMLFLSGDAVSDAQVQICLAECKIAFTPVAAPRLPKELECSRMVCYRDNDVHHTEVEGVDAILGYLDRFYHLDSSVYARPCAAYAYHVIQIVKTLQDSWKRRDRRGVERGLALLGENLVNEGGPFISGRRFGVADCAVWPVLHESVEGKHDGGSVGGGGEEKGKVCDKTEKERAAVETNGTTIEAWTWSEDKFPVLWEYYKGCWKRKASVRKVVEKLGERVCTGGAGKEKI